MSDAINDKLSRHDETISLLQIEQAILGAQMQAIEAQIYRNQTALIECLDRIEKKTDITTEWMYESKGGLKLGRWITITSLTIIGLAVAFLKFFKS